MVNNLFGFSEHFSSFMLSGNFLASLYMSIKPLGSALALQSFECLPWELSGDVVHPEQMLDLCGDVMPLLSAYQRKNLMGVQCPKLCLLVAHASAGMFMESRNSWQAGTHVPEYKQSVEVVQCAVETLFLSSHSTSGGSVYPGRGTEHSSCGFSSSQGGSIRHQAWPGVCYGDKEICRQRHSGDTDHACCAFAA